jgi:GTP-binding protein
LKPVIAIVGRPNVGKSTLFNRVTRSRDAIVADFPGLTRDRHYGDAKLGSREFIVVDTGGFEPESDTGIVREMARQTRQAVAESDIVIFVVDARAGLSVQDHDIATFLRSQRKKVVLAANKAEGMRDAPVLAEFFELGIGAPLAISSAHGQGIRSLIETALDELVPPGPEAPIDAADGADADGVSRPIRLAVAGRPNVGKSTLINAWLGEERLVAFDQPGTTRDAISVPFEREGRRFELIDTAGLRRKGRVFEAVEKFSVVKTLQAIADAHVVLLLLDATQGVSEQDAHIAGYILESGRAVAVAVNKWDTVDAYQREMVARSIAQRLAFLDFAPVLHVSALKRQGLGPVWKSLLQAHASATRKFSTPDLNRLLRDAVAFQQPPRAGRFRPKLRYAHQGGSNPPIVVVHGTSLDHVPDSYKRYLVGRIRDKFGLVGTPVRVEMRSADNPFVEDR